MASLYRRGETFWIAYTVNGKRVLRSLHTANERIARDKKKQLEYELMIGDLQTESRLELPFILEEFCRHLKARSPHKARNNDVSKLRCFFGPICESLQLGRHGGTSTRRCPDKYGRAHVKATLLEEITPEQINQFISARLREDKWAPKTANGLREILHRLFNFAIRHHGFRSRVRRHPNPATAVERVREPAPEIRFLTLVQIDRQLVAVEDRPLIHALVATFVYAGLRREEAFWLTREDVDLEQRIIRVRAKTIEQERWQPKTKRNRAVPISEALLAILKAYQPPCRSTWYFPSPTGKRWDPDNFSQDLRKINKANGLDWGCLDFRHTFGSQLAQKGESLYKIATLMGNSPAICQRHYAALIPEAMHDTVEFPTEALNKGVRPSVDNAATQALVDRLLKELEARQEARPKEPSLRLVAISDDG
ncbi:MAG: tyrosine-type recombinase/integrase [Phycisphaerae bacterium]|nr:tyrosine-type recombinase/integrase [Phycisphaerae bacterium]